MQEPPFARVVYTYFCLPPPGATVVAAWSGLPRDVVTGFPVVAVVAVVAAWGRPR